MNYTSYICLLSILLSFTYTSRSHTTQDTQNPYHNQQRENDFPDYFFKPLIYSEQSITFFLKKIYNDRKYPQYFLSHNFTHVIEGINFAHESCQPRLTIEKILSLFCSKLDTIYINPYAFSHFLSAAHPTLARYCNKHQERSYITEAIKETVGSYLIDNYELFKQDPEKTIQELAESLYTLTVEPHVDGDLSVRELQHVVYTFISQAISQLIWNPADQLDTWNNVKLLSCQIEKLTEYYIIDTKMLDPLLWKLLRRYSYFISLVAKELDQEFFNGVRADLLSERAALWLLEEKEEYITSKLEYLTTTLIEAEIIAQMNTLAGEAPPLD